VGRCHSWRRARRLEICTRSGDGQAEIQQFLIAVLWMRPEVVRVPAESCTRKAFLKMRLRVNCPGVKKSDTFQLSGRTGAADVVRDRSSVQLEVGNGCQALHPIVDGESLVANFHPCSHVAPSVVPKGALGTNL